MPGIVVGVDGSPGSRAALQHAVGEAIAHDEELRVVYAYSVSEPRQDPTEPLPANVELRHRAERALEEIVADVDSGDGPVKIAKEAVAVRGGNAARALIHASRGATMLVVGSRGLEGFTGLLVGSVSQQCVQHAACPVLVVPRSDDRRG